MAQKFLSDIHATAGVKDSSGDLGTSGQVLSSTGSETNWVNPTVGTTVIYKDTFYDSNAATDGQTVFTLANTVDSEDKTQVYIDGAYQSKGGYTVSGTTLTFDTGLAEDSEVEVITFSTATANNAASAVKLDTFDTEPNGTLLTFVLDEAVVDEKVTQVYINGVYQEKSTYSIDSDLVTLRFGTGNAPPNNSTVEVISFKTITSTDGTLTATTFLGDLNGTINTATTATTQLAGTNTTQLATTAFVKTSVDNIVDIAPDALNTLNELAFALNDDANFSTTVTNSIATKLPLAGGTLTGSLSISNSSGDTLTLTKSTTEPSLRIEGDTNKDFVITVSGQLLTFTQNDGATDILTLDHDTKAATFSGSVSAVRLFSASGGNATNPMIAVATDQDTGIFFPSANTMAFTTGNAERMRISSGGNVGILTTPSTEATVGLSVAGTSGASGVAAIELKGSGNPAPWRMISSYDGTNPFWGLYYPSDSAYKFTIASNGDVMIGDSTTDVTSKLTVSGNGSVNTATFMYDGSAGTYLDIDTEAANGSVILRADARSGNYPPMLFKTGGSTRLTISSGGDVVLNQASSKITGGGTTAGRFILQTSAGGNAGGGTYMVMTGSTYPSIPNTTYFVNNSVVSMLISSGGNVGIGTSTLSSTNRLTLLESTGNGETILIKGANQGATGSQPGMKFVSSIGDNIGGIYADTYSDNVNIQTGGVPRLTISNTGTATFSGDVIGPSISLGASNGRVSATQGLFGTTFCLTSNGRATFGSTSSSVPIALAIDGNGASPAVLIETNNNTTFSGTVSHQGLQMTSGAQTDQIISITKTLNGGANAWHDTGIYGSAIPNNGSFIVQVYNNVQQSGVSNYAVYWTGIMSWYYTTTNSIDISEIHVNSAGHYRGMSLELRTISSQVSASPNNMRLQFKSNQTLSNHPSFVFSFRRLI